MAENLFERRVNTLTGILERRANFAERFFGIGERPPFTRKLNRADKAAYFQGLPPEQQQGLWQQMDETERAEVMGIR